MALKRKTARQQMRQHGFTIVETLIVLAVTAGLFVSVAAEISNREKNTEFSQSVQALKSQLDQFINQVAIGYYPNSGTDFTCKSVASSPLGTPLNISTIGGGQEQGTNQGCILVGKVLNFNAVSGASTGTQQIYGYALAGRQIGPDGAPIDLIDDASPTILAGAAGTFPNEKQTFNMQYGLSIGYVCYGNCVPAAAPLAPVNSTGSLAFVSLGNTLATGNQAVNLLPVGGSSSINNTASSEIGDITNFLGTNGLGTKLNPAGGAHICVIGGNGQSAILDIGDSGNALSVTVNIKSNDKCI